MYRSARGRFNKDGGSVSDLIKRIRENVSEIKKGADTLETALGKLWTDEDNSYLRKSIHEASQRTNMIVQVTTGLLRKAADRQIHKSQEFTLYLLEVQFEDSVQRFQILQKKVTDQMQTPVKLGGYAAKCLRSYEDIQNMDAHLRDIWKEIQILKDELGDDEEDLNQEKKEQIHKMEADLLDLKEIYKDLGALFVDQEDLLDNMNDTTEHATSHTMVKNEAEVLKMRQQHKTLRRRWSLLEQIIFLSIAVIIVLVIVMNVY